MKGVIVFYKKKICFVLILALCMLQFSACKSKIEDSNNSSVEVFTINESKIYLDEVLYRVWESENDNSYYSKSFKEQYNKSYWDSDIVKGTTVRENLKDELYENILRDSLLYQKAVEEGCSLTKDEKAVCKEEAGKEFDSMSADVKKTIGATNELLVNLKEKKSIVSKYFTSLLETYKVDEDSIRDSFDSADYEQLDIQTIGFSKYTYDENGAETAKSDEENQMGLESLKAIASDAKAADNFNDLLTDDSDTLETEDLSIIPGDSACEEEIEEAALSMQPGDTSDVIETDKGYYIIRLVDNSSEEAYEEAVQNAIKQEKYKQFDAYYETVKEDADIQTTKEWDGITIGGTVIKE